MKKAKAKARQKPRLALLSGAKATDVNELAKLYESLTGRQPTNQELEDAKKELRK